jgi:23S rRNA (adenine1618-N6)-methyltransferase
MANPPFYSNTAELLTSASLKSRPPFTACTGSASEMVTPGGETAFVTRLISESLVLRSRIRWYTAMLGKLSSVSSLVATLREHRVDNYAVTEFIQGTKTRRWGLAWSFGDRRPAMAAARAARGAGIPKGLLPFPSEYVITVSLSLYGLLGLIARRRAHLCQLPINTTGLLVRTTNAIDATLTSLQLQWQWEPAIGTGVGFTSKNVWSRSARRKSAHTCSDQGGSDDTEDEMLFGFKIRVWEDQSKEEKQIQMVQDAGQELAIHVLVRWLKGHDSILFESFCGMLKRKLGA